MQYLLLVIVLAAALVLSVTWMPMRNDSLLPREIRQELDQGLEQMPGEVSGKLPGKPGSGGEAYYRWRDSEGRWQYGDRPPPGVDYERVDPPSTNTLSPEEFQGKVPRDKPE